MSLQRRKVALSSLACAAFAVGAAERQALPPGQRIDRPLSGGEAHRYEVPLPKDQAVEVRVAGHGIPLALSLEGRDGAERLRGPRLLVLSDGEAPRLVVRALRQDVPQGRYTLTLSPARAAAEADRLRFQGSLLLHDGRRRLESENHAALLEAQQDLDGAWRRFEEAGDPHGQSEALGALAQAQERLGDATGALERLEQARALAVAAGDPLLEGDARVGLGLLLSRIGRMEEALGHLRTGVSLARARADRGREGKALRALGTALAHGERGDEAILQLEEALPLVVAEGDLLEEAGVHNTLGGLYVQLGDGEQALVHVQTTLDLHRRLGRPHAGFLNNLGIVLGGLLGRHAEAMPYLEQALAIYRADGNRLGEGFVLDTMGANSLQLGRYDEALGSLGKGLAIWREADHARGLSTTSAHLGDAWLKLGDAAKAREAFETALREARRSGRAQVEVWALLGLARVALGEASLREGLAKAEQAVSLVESSRQAFSRSELRATYFSVVRPAYDLYIELLMRAGDAGAALRASERARARTLLDALAAADPKAPPLPMPPQAEPAEIQGRLDEGTVLVEYALGESSSYAWVVTRERLRAVTLGGRGTLEAGARRVVELVTARNRPLREGVARRGQVAAADAALPAALREMSDGILGPLALPEAARLIFVADGALQYVPFAALPLPGSEEPLVARRQVVMLPSASVLPALRTSPWRARGPVAVLADPVFRSDDPRVPGAPRSRPDPAMRLLLRSAAESGLADLPRLRFSRAEADTIARLAGSRSQLFLDFAASREAVASAEVGRARVVHFATHGLLNSKNPDLTGLVLSMVDEQGGSRDGFLRLPDLNRLRLEAELVVLSACQTALGKEIRGEGVVGLTRGFMLAGAPRVVASLWRVDDQGTAELMKRFYAAIFERELAPAAALGEAQRGLAADPRWKSPYYWAAFTLHGDWH